jgi:hypothetical protein
LWGKLGLVRSFVHFSQEVERERARERVLKREELGEQGEGRNSRVWSLGETLA